MEGKRGGGRNETEVSSSRHMEAVRDFLYAFRVSITNHVLIRVLPSRPIRSSKVPARRARDVLADKRLEA